MSDLAIKDCAVLIGFSPEGKCVYSASVPLHEYWDGEHVWDKAASVKKLRLEKVRGFLFESSGELLQEFESFFDISTGIFKKGWAKHADGTYKEW